MLNQVEYVLSKILKKMHLRAIKNSLIHKTSSVEAGSQFVNSSMDRHSFCGYDCIITGTKIGSFCSIAGNCEIGGATHTINWVSTSPVFNENRDQIKKKYALHSFDPFRETIIGHDVWIGARSIVKAGVTIGSGSVVGMGSVVTKDIPPYEIWAGNPARLIRKRFDEVVIEGMLDSKWWELDDETLEKAAAHIKEPRVFLDVIKSRKVGTSNE